MKRDTESLAQISARTVAHYNGDAQAFWDGTRDHDVTQNIDAMLGRVEGAPPYSILDLGCGPGRDLKALRLLGHAPVGVDGASRFVDMAREYSGCDVWHQDFLALRLPDARFDAIFANASLFHVPRAELPRVLRELHASLKPRGVLFASNPRGSNDEGWNRGRYGAYHDLASWTAYLQQAGFALLEFYYRPEGVPAEQQRWLATVARKL